MKKNLLPRTFEASLFLPAISLTLACLPAAQAGVVTLLPSDINGGDSATASFSNADVTLTPLQGGAAATFNGNAARLGIDDFGTNVNAFNDPDTDPNNGNEEQLEFQFSATAGLTGISWDYSRADGPDPLSGVIISGFSSDPGATLSGATGGGSVSYSNGSLLIKVGYVSNGDDGILTLSNPGASAGATLLLSVTDEDQAGAQLAVTSISYEDAVPTQAPVINDPLPATLSPGDGVSTTLAVGIEAGAAPAPTYLWEYDDGGGFVTVGTDLTYTFTAGAATDGTYRVTITNVAGSDSSTTVVTAIDDGDGIDNQWEVDNFGDFLLYGATDDVDTPDPDGLDNAGEFAAGTDPNDPDTDDDGLLDGDEAANNANPLVADTDGDGFWDGYEVNTAGSAADDPDDAPIADSGRNSIGITFAATAGNGANVNLSPLALAGAPGYVQKNWNTPPAFPNAAVTTTELDITSPTAGALVDSSGNTTTATYFIQSAGAFSRLNNPQISASGLYSGYLFANATDDTVFIDIDNVPYSRYDVVIYVMGFGANVTGTVTDAIDGLAYTFGAPAILAEGDEPQWYRSADQTTVSNGTFENFPTATHVIFRGLSGSNQSFDLTRIIDNAGIAAIQIVEAPDSDGDGMGDVYEISAGLDPNDDGTTDPVNEGANGDFDGDGIFNIDEHDNGTNPTSDDTDNDGYTDDVETDTGTFNSTADPGTDPRIADGDGDGLLDGVESGGGTFVDETNTGTDPFVADTGDTDLDGWADNYEILNGPTDYTDPADPGGPNPAGFAIAFNSIAGFGTSGSVEFGDLVFAGAPGVEQRNWNRTIDLANNDVDASGDITKIGTPNLGELVDSSGTVIGDGATGVGVSFSAGNGAFSSQPDPATPYGRLFNSFIFGRDTGVAGQDPDSSITLTGIPYASYDVYVYFGSESDNRIGTISSSSAGTTYSFTTDVNTGSPGSYLQTTDTGTAYPQANYAVFSGQTGGTFDVTVTVGALQNSMGIYGIQVVDTSGAGGPMMVLENPQYDSINDTFTADFVTDTAGTYIFERSQTLGNDWIQIGSALTVGAGTTPVTDPAAPSDEAFYRVREP